MLSPPDKRKAPLLKTFWRRLCISGVTRGLTKGGKFTWRDSTNQYSEKSWEAIVNPDMDVYPKKSEIDRNILKNAKQTTYWKPKDYRTILKYKQTGDPAFTFILPWGWFVPLTPRQLRHWKFSLPGAQMHSLQTSDAFTSNLRCIHFKPQIAETYLVTQRLFAKKLQKVRSSATSIPRNHCFDRSVAHIPIINNCRRMTQRNTKIIKTFQ